jgi:spoIIIJ-associated protein
VSGDVSVEAEGETVGEAKWAALRELERRFPGLARDSVRFQVVTEGERGLLGVGFVAARVVATAPAPPSQAPPEEAPSTRSAEQELVREFLELATAAIGASASVRVDTGPDEIVATVTGDDLGMVIGRHGQTIDALQYLANAMSHRRLGDAHRHVTVDAAGYRKRRSETLAALALESAERAAATGHRVALEPMTAVERKVVHEALKDDPAVETASEGTEPNRCVVVIPRRSAD